MMCVGGDGCVEMGGMYFCLRSGPHGGLRWGTGHPLQRSSVGIQGAGMAPAPMTHPGQPETGPSSSGRAGPPAGPAECRPLLARLLAGLVGGAGAPPCWRR